MWGFGKGAGAAHQIPFYPPVTIPVRKWGKSWRGYRQSEDWAGGTGSWSIEEGFVVGHVVKNSRWSRCTPGLVFGLETCNYFYFYHVVIIIGTTTVEIVMSCAHCDWLLHMSSASVCTFERLCAENFGVAVYCQTIFCYCCQNHPQELDQNFRVSCCWGLKINTCHCCKGRSCLTIIILPIWQY